MVESLNLTEEAKCFHPMDIYVSAEVGNSLKVAQGTPSIHIELKAYVSAELGNKLKVAQGSPCIHIELKVARKSV